MKVTMRDVARAAGVSPMTVSNVLNERASVSADLRERVLTAVEDLGYELNLSARALRSGRTHTVALAVPQFDHPYFGALSTALAHAVRARGLHLVVEQRIGAGDGTDLAALAGARVRQYDGVVLTEGGLTNAQIEALALDFPVVLLGEQQVPAHLDHIAMGNVEGGRLATEHLLATGSRRIAVLGGSTDDRGLGEFRTAGWRLAHERAGLIPDPALIVPAARFDGVEGRDLVLDLCRRDPSVDGIFAVTDSLAIGALAGAVAAGRRVPQQVQVVGFDNLDVDEVTVPALTSVDPDLDWIVMHVVDLLIARIERSERPIEHLTAPARLRVRASTRT